MSATEAYCNWPNYYQLIDCGKNTIIQHIITKIAVNHTYKQMTAYMISIS